MTCLACIQEMPKGVVCDFDIVLEECVSEIREEILDKRDGSLWWNLTISHLMQCHPVFLGYDQVHRAGLVTQVGFGIISHPVMRGRDQADTLYGPVGRHTDICCGQLTELHQLLSTVDQKDGSIHKRLKRG